MTTYGALRERVLRMLGNPDGEGIADELVVDAISASHDAILPWCPKQVVTLITGDGINTSFALPADFYEVQALIVQNTGEIITKGILVPGTYYGEGSAGTNTWLILPSGMISLAKPPSTDAVYDLYYFATWGKPEVGVSGETVLEPPSYLENAMALYAISYLLLPDVVSAAGYGTFKTRTDSGNPEHNPLQKSVTFFMNLFNQEMNRHPKIQRSQA